MFFDNPLIYINANIDIEDNFIILEQVNSYKYSLNKFFEEIKKRRECIGKDNTEIFCILGNKEEIDDKENIIMETLCNRYINIILENEKSKYPKICITEIDNGISCLGLYFTDNDQEETEMDFKVENVIGTFLEKEKPFFMGKQIMIQSFLLEDVKDRKILAVLPNEYNEWYALLEGGIKLYLNNEIPYQREKISSNEIGRWTNLEIDSIINNPIYSYKKLFFPYELFEEWNSVFLYALAILQVEYETKRLELLYRDFLEFIENNICYVQEANAAIISKEEFTKALITSINHIREYLEGKDEVGISKNMLILLKSRCCYLLIIFKIIEKHYPEQVCQRMDFLPFSVIEWKELLERVQKVQNNYDKGIALEDVAHYFIDCINGLRVTQRRSRTDNEEMDLVCCNLYNNSELWKLGPVVLIECKNWAKKIEAKEIRNLSYIMDKKGVGTLLLFAKNDITAGAKEEIMKQAAHNKFILVFNLQDLNKTNNPIDLLNLKLEQLEDDISGRMENLM